MDFEKITLGGPTPFQLEEVAPGWFSAAATAQATAPPLKQERQFERRSSNTTTTTTNTTMGPKRQKQQQRRRRRSSQMENNQDYQINKTSKLLSIPPEILYMIVYNDELTDHDRLHLRLIHPTINSIVSMKPFLPVIIPSITSGRMVSSELRHLLLPENNAMHGYIQSLTIRMNESQSGPVFDYNKLHKLTGLIEITLDLSFEVYSDGELLANRHRGLHSLIKGLSGCDVDMFSVKMRNMHVYTSVLSSLSGVGELELEYTRNCDLSMFAELRGRYKSMIGGVILRSPGMKHLSLSAGFSGLEVDGILDEVPPDSMDGLRSISLDNVKPPRKLSNINKLSGLSSFSMPVSKNHINTVIDDSTLLDDEVDIWTSLPPMTDITVPGLSAYYYNNLPSTYNYITTQQPSTIRNLTIHFSHPSFPLAESLKKMAEYGQLFWKTVFPYIQNTIVGLRLQADTSSFAVALVRCHTVLGDDAAPVVTKMVKRALVNITPPYIPTSNSLEEVEMSGMFFGVDKLHEEMGRFNGCNKLRKLKLSLVEDRIVKNDVLLSEGDDISAALIEGGGGGGVKMAEVALYRYSLDSVVKMEREVEGGCVVTEERDTMYSLVPKK